MLDIKLIEQAVANAMQDISNINKASNITFPVEASARHVHLTQDAVEALFGNGAALEKKRELSQPGEFLSSQRVKIVTAKGVIENVAILGPTRSKTQIELSRTDTRTLGIKAPINNSGNLTNAASAYLIGDKGMLHVTGGVIIAKAHIHMNCEDAKEFNLVDNQIVSVNIDNERSLNFNNVLVRVNKAYALAMHIDFDEANACDLNSGDFGKIVGFNFIPPPNLTSIIKPMPAEELVNGLIIESHAKKLVIDKPQYINFAKGTIITPLAKDVFSYANCEVRYID